MRVVCAWCGAVITEATEFERRLAACCEQEVATSHGICPACFEEQEAVLTGMAPPPANPGKAGGEA